MKLNGALRQQIMKERGAFCQHCKAPDIPWLQQLKLHLHHVLRQTRFPERRKDRDNILLLCQECHEKFELITPIIEEIFRTDEFAYYDNLRVDNLMLSIPSGGHATAGVPRLKGVRFD